VGRTPYELLGAKLIGLARDEAEAVAGAIERWTVLHTNPLVIEQIDGDVILEEGDPDFTVGDWLRQHREIYGLVNGSLVWVAAVPEPEGGVEWHAFDVVSDSEMIDLSGAGGSGEQDTYPVFLQDDPLAVWVVPYTGDSPPAVTIVETDGTEVAADIEYDEDAKTITITHGAPMSGRVYRT
jgi:hypothetical protein